MYIKTSETTARTHAPNRHGMHPQVAEMLGARAPEIAEQIRANPPADPDATPAPLLRFSQRGLTVRQPRVGPRGALELAIDVGDVRETTPLIQQAGLRYQNADFIADTVMPVQLVQDRVGEYILWGRDDDYYVPDLRIGLNGNAKEVEPEVSRDSYSVTDYAIKSWISDDVIRANGSLNVRMRNMELVRDQLEFAREIRVAAVFMTAANYASTNKATLGGTAKWNGGSAADPVTDVLTAQAALPSAATHVIMSDLVWQAAQLNTTLRTILASQLDNKGLLRPMDFSLYFGIPNMIFSRRFKKDSSGNVVRVWGSSDAWFGTINPAPGALTFAKTFRLRQGSNGVVVGNWRDQDRGVNGGEWFRAAHSDADKIVAADHGYLLSAVRQ